MVAARPIFLQLQKIEGVETSTRTTQKSPNAIPKVFTTHFGITWEPLITQKPKNHEWSADFKILCEDIIIGDACLTWKRRKYVR